MDVNKIKKALIEQRKLNLSGNLYYKTQINFSYNTNHMEGSTITKEETISIYDTGSILVDKEKVIVLKDLTETKNHFTLFKHMLDTLNEPLSETLIKDFHFILKNGTIDDEEAKWFNVGEYKKVRNFVGDTATTDPNKVSEQMKLLIENYSKKKIKTIEDIIEFHVKFESIHPFQDGNGRVGRVIMFRECLNNNIIPFYIETRNKPFYIRGLQEYEKGEKGYLIDTCLNSQDNYFKLCNLLLNED